MENILLIFFATFQESDRKFWHQQELDKIQAMKQERKLALQHRDRLKRMAVDKNAYLSKLESQRLSTFKVNEPCLRLILIFISRFLEIRVLLIFIFVSIIRRRN